MSKAPTYRQLADALRDAVSEIKYLAPESFDDAAHKRNFTSNVKRLEKLVAAALVHDVLVLNPTKKGKSA